MSTPTGLDCKLYRNSATYATPTWIEMKNVKDLTLNGETAEADVSARKSRFRLRARTLIDLGIDFDYLKDTIDLTNYHALRSAWLGSADVEFAVADGDITVQGTEYLRFTGGVFKFTENQPLENGVGAAVTIKPTPSAHDPAFVIVP